MRRFFKCWYMDCESDTRTNPELIFYGFPSKDVQRCDLWIRNCSNPILKQQWESQRTLRSHWRVCQKHFIKEFQGSTKTLTYHAVPVPYGTQVDQIDVKKFLEECAAIKAKEPTRIQRQMMQSVVLKPMSANEPVGGPSRQAKRIDASTNAAARDATGHGSSDSDEVTIVDEIAAPSRQAPRVATVTIEPALTQIPPQLPSTSPPKSLETGSSDNLTITDTDNDHDDGPAPQPEPPPEKNGTCSQDPGSQAQPQGHNLDSQTISATILSTHSDPDTSHGASQATSNLSNHDQFQEKDELPRTTYEPFQDMPDMGNVDLNDIELDESWFPLAISPTAYEPLEPLTTPDVDFRGMSPECTQGAPRSDDLVGRSPPPTTSASPGELESIAPDDKETSASEPQQQK